MSVKRCDRCKFWDTDDQKRAGSVVASACSRALMWWDATEWADADDPSYDRRLTAEAAGTMMFVQDGSDYSATLYTTADFHCAHFSTGQMTDKELK